MHKYKYVKDLKIRSWPNWLRAHHTIFWDCKRNKIFSCIQFVQLLNQSKKKSCPLAKFGNTREKLYCVCTIIGGYDKKFRIFLTASPFFFFCHFRHWRNFCSEAKRSSRLAGRAVILFKEVFWEAASRRRICIPHHLCPCVCVHLETVARPWFTSSAPVAAGTRDQPLIYDRA